MFIDGNSDTCPQPSGGQVGTEMRSLFLLKDNR